jgi:hypothetical protein
MVRILKLKVEISAKSTRFGSLAGLAIERAKRS